MSLCFYDYLSAAEAYQLKKENIESIKYYNYLPVTDTHNKPAPGYKAIYQKQGNVITLYSYYTAVLSYNTKTKVLRRLWYGYSPTTLKHINLFLQNMNICSGFSKKQWEALKRLNMKTGVFTDTEGR